MNIRSQLVETSFAFGLLTMDINLEKNKIEVKYKNSVISREEISRYCQSVYFICDSKPTIYIYKGRKVNYMINHNGENCYMWF